MKRILASFGIAAILASGLTAFTPAGADAETVDITLVAGHPPVFRWVKHANSTFIPAVNKALEGTNIKVNWMEQYGGSLAKVGDELEAVEQGLAEIGLISTVFDPAKMAIQNVTYFTPFVSRDATQVSKFMDELQLGNAELRASWEANGLEYLGGAIGIDDYLLMTNFPVKSIDDLKGKKIAAPGPAVNWLKGTGAVGVSGNLTTYYNEMKTGVYDGVIVFASAALPGKLHEVAPYVSLVGFGAQYAGGIAANKDWFDAQPKELQDALKAAAVEDRIAYHADLEEGARNALKTMQAAGATVTEMDEAFRKQWAAGMENVAKVWAEELDGQDQPGTSVLKTYMEGMRSDGAAPVRNWDEE